jgi:hypothetical protein
MLNKEIPLDVAPKLDFQEFSKNQNKNLVSSKYDFKYII